MKPYLLLPAILCFSVYASALDWTRDPGVQFKAIMADAAPAAPAAVPVNESTLLENETQDALDAWAKAPSRQLWDQFQDLVRRHEELLKTHSNDAGLHLSYGNLLGAMGEDYEDKAVAQWDLARTLDPSNPDPWNNLANYYGHRSPVKKAFEYYEKAVSLDPNEPVYLWNFATTVFLFRKDAREYYSIDEQQVFDKALGLYRKALALVPDNYELASDLAISYYGIKPDRTQAAIADWEYALKIAPSDLEKQRVHIHLARWEMKAGRFDKAQAHVDAVTEPGLQDLKARVERNLKQKQGQKP